MAMAGLPNMKGLISNGSLRPLAVTSKTRMAALPDVPTTQEAGFPSVQMGNWFGLVAPQGLSPEIAAKLHTAAVKALRTPSVVQTMEDAGLMIVASTPDEMAQEIRQSAERFRRVIEQIGIEKQ